MKAVILCIKWLCDNNVWKASLCNSVLKQSESWTGIFQMNLNIKWGLYAVWYCNTLPMPIFFLGFCKSLPTDGFCFCLKRQRCHETPVSHPSEAGGSTGTNTVHKIVKLELKTFSWISRWQCVALEGLTCIFILIFKHVSYCPTNLQNRQTNVMWSSADPLPRLTCHVKIIFTVSVLKIFRLSLKTGFLFETVLMHNSNIVWNKLLLYLRQGSSPNVIYMHT